MSGDGWYGGGGSWWASSSEAHASSGWAAVEAPCCTSSPGEAGLDELKEEVRQLQRRLRNAEEQRDCYWRILMGQSAQKDEPLAASMPSAGSKLTSLRLSSPLTRHQECRTDFQESPSPNRWKYWSSACPCCRRPLDVTLLPEGTVPEPPAGAGALRGVKEGSELRCLGLPRGSSLTAPPLFVSAQSFSQVEGASIQVGDHVVATGPAELTGRHAMVPVRFLEDDRHTTKGYVDGSCFEVVKAWQRKAGEATPRYAYCAAIWGANAGYILGAAVLGRRLRELSEGLGAQAPHRVLLHTDDLPVNGLELLRKYWICRQVEYVEGVDELYHGGKGGCFDGVFTKVTAWSLTDYEKVLLLDLDLCLLRTPYPLFELPAPAAMVRGCSSLRHGEAVDGRMMFSGEASENAPWGQGGGINAGVILLAPCQETFEQMVREITCPQHPEHIRGNGPEQDYLSRFFAWAPWTNIDVTWNFQLHHVPFALERCLNWKRSYLNDGDVKAAEEDYKPRRLLVSEQEIGIVHVSGEVKPWHFFLGVKQDTGRRCVNHGEVSWDDADSFCLHLLQDCCRYNRCWLRRGGFDEDYAHHGCTVDGDGRVTLSASDPDKAWCTTDVTELADHTAGLLWRTVHRSVEEFRRTAGQLLAEETNALEGLRHPTGPAGCFPPGTAIEICWPPAASPEVGCWREGLILAVHLDGTYVVKYAFRSNQGDTERNVEASRIRLPTRPPATQEEPISEGTAAPAA